MALGGTLLVLPWATSPLAPGGPAGISGGGCASLSLPLPAIPGLTGLNLNFQVLLLDPAAAPAISMTNAVEMWIA